MPFENMPAKPLQFADFSGGITDNVLQGDPRRMETCDNFFITVDKKLKMRPGLTIFDAQAPQISPGQKVNGLYAAINETVLVGQSGRDLYAFDAFNHAWNKIPGIAGNQALSGGDFNSQTSMAEFQRQLYFVDDGNQDLEGANPTKVYRDTSNVWHAYSTGLPRAFTLPTQTDASLLIQACAMANSLRYSMVSHISDAVYSTYTPPPYVANYQVSSILATETGNPNNLHWNVDKWSLSYLLPQTFDPNVDKQASPTALFSNTPLYRNGRSLIPSTVPTPVYTATDLPSLIALTQAMINAYNHHTNDATFGSINDPTADFPYYHYNIPNDGCINTVTPVYSEITARRARGPLIAVQSALLSTATVDDVVVVLNDLYQKWYFHRYSVQTHSSTNDLTVLSRYAPTIGKITNTLTDTKKAPTITADYSDLYNYVNQLKALFNFHITDTNGTTNSGNITWMHTQSDSYYQTMNQFGQFQVWRSNFINLPDCSDLDSMYLLTYWLRAMFFQHQQDSALAFTTTVTATFGLGASNATAVTEIGSRTSTASGIEFDRWLYAIAPLFGAINGTSSPRDFTGASSVARIRSTGSGTMTIDRPATSGFTGTMLATRSKQHGYFTVTDNVYSYTQVPAATTTSPATSSDALASPQTAYGTDVATWLELATEVFTAMNSHATDLPIHVPPIHDIYKSLFIRLNPQFFVPTVSTLAYAFYFSNDYTVEPNGIEYLVQGNPVFTDSLELATSYPVGAVITSQNPALYTNTAVTNPRANTITGLPVIKNTSDTNYDLANINLQIYRSTDGGNTFYFLDKVPNGTTSYTDTTNDSLAPLGSTPLDTRQIIYTAGGVVGFDQPPKAKFIHQLNGIMYFAGVTDTGQFFPNRLRHSVQYSPDACPATFFDDFDDEITGLSSTRSNLIVFCKNSVYRESGAFNSLGQGSLTHDNISDTLGCLNARSIVRTEIGVFFAGNDGFYYTDGYQIIKISLELDKTYASLTGSDTQRRAIFGAYDKLTRRVWWSMRSGSTEATNDVSFVYYLDFGVKPSGTFTRITGGAYSPSALVFQQGVAIVGQDQGFVLKLDQYTKYDLVVENGVDPSQWLRTNVPYHYRSTAIDFGTTFQRKWLTKLHILGQNSGNMMIAMNAVRDLNANGNGIKSFSEINYTENPRWGAPADVWGTPTDQWRYDGKMDVIRRWPDNLMRSDFMQVEILPANGVVYASQNPEWPARCRVLVGDWDSVNKLRHITLTCDDPTRILLWPVDVPGYELVMDWDNYQTQYTVLFVNGFGNEIVVQDLTGLMPDATYGYQWMILGTKKAQAPTVTSFVIHYSYLGDEVQSYDGKTLASGPGNSGANS